jgi:hypothetical protein
MNSVGVRSFMYVPFPLNSKMILLITNGIPTVEGCLFPLFSNNFFNVGALVSLQLYLLFSVILWT